MSSDEEVRRFTDGEIVPIVAALRELLMCARKGPLVHDTECNRSFPTEKDSRGQIMEFPWTFHDHALMVNALNALPRLLTTVAALSAPPGKGEAREHDLARIIHNAVAVANGADPEAASRLFDSYEPESLRYEEWHAAARGALAGATTPILYGMFDGKGRLASHCPTRDLMDEFAADLNDGGKYAETKESSWIYEKPYTVVPLYVAPPAAPAACPAKPAANDAGTGDDGLDDDGLDDESVVCGRMVDRSLASFVRGCEVRIEEITADPNGDTGLVAVLCDAVRLAREYTDYVRRNAPSLPRAAAGTGAVKSVRAWMEDEEEHARFEAHVLRRAAEQFPVRADVADLVTRSPASRAHYANSRIQTRWEGWIGALTDRATLSPLDGAPDDGGAKS